LQAPTGGNVHCGPSPQVDELGVNQALQLKVREGTVEALI